MLASTNLALPRSQWSRLATNQFNADGTFSFLTPLAPGAPQRFFTVQVP